MGETLKRADIKAALIKLNVPIEIDTTTPDLEKLLKAAQAAKPVKPRKANALLDRKAS